MRPHKGAVSVKGIDSFRQSELIMQDIGYLPGEIVFPAGLTGLELLRFMLRLKNLTDETRMNELIEIFELDTDGEIKTYSKGMKQKLGIIIAFMHNPRILVLDEPTSGLDPLMRNKFIELILNEKDKGKTIFISSHLFDEIERVCDEVIIIKDGRIIEKANIKTLKEKQRKCFVIKTNNEEELYELEYETGNASDNGVEVYVYGHQLDRFIKDISKLEISNIEQKNQNLDEIFMQYY